MRKEVNYIEEYQREMMHFEQSEIESLVTDREIQHFELLKELIHIKSTQYKKNRNPEKIEKVKDFFYPELCDMAKFQGGRVVLDIDEDLHFAQLTYTGGYLILGETNQSCFLDFLDIMTAADDVIFSVKANYFEIQFLFALYDKVRVEDHSKEIQETIKRMQHYQMLPK